jgi:hypothetical protein
LYARAESSSALREALQRHSGTQTGSGSSTPLHCAEFHVLAVLCGLLVAHLPAALTAIHDPHHGRFRGSREEGHDTREAAVPAKKRKKSSNEHVSEETGGVIGADSLGNAWIAAPELVITLAALLRTAKVRVVVSAVQCDSNPGHVNAFRCCLTLLSCMIA